MKKVLLYYHFSCTRGGGDFLPLSFLEELHRISDVTLAVDVERAVLRRPSNSSDFISTGLGSGSCP